MSQASQPGPKPQTAGSLAAVRLELRHGSAKPAFYEVSDAGFLVGSVPGCDLRLPGASLPPVICLITRHAGGAEIRKLAPVLPLLVNGNVVTSGPLQDGDRVSLGAVDLFLHVDASAVAAQAAPARPSGGAAAKDVEKLKAELAAAQAELALRPRSAQETGPELTRRREELDARAREIEHQEQEVAKVGQELDAIRTQLHERYRQRRDKLASRETAVRRAARKVKLLRRQLEANRLRTDQQSDDHATRENTLAAQAQELDQERHRLDSQRHDLERDLARRLEECQDRERRLADEQLALEQRKSELAASADEVSGESQSLQEQHEQLGAREAEVEKNKQTLARERARQEEAKASLEQRRQQLNAEIAEFARTRQEGRLQGERAAVVTRELQARETALANAAADIAQREEVVQQAQSRFDQEREQLEARAAQVARQQEEVRTLSQQLEILRKQLHERYRHERERLAKLQAAIRAGARKLIARKRHFDVLGSAENARQTELLAWEQSLTGRDADLIRQREELEARAQDLAERQQACDAMQNKLAETGKQLDERYQRRRDRLAGLQGSVRRAARKVYQRRKQLEEERQQFAVFQEEVAARQAEVERVTADLGRQRQDLEELGRQLDNRQQLYQKELTDRLSECQEHERALSTERQALTNTQKQHQEDLVRLDRLEAALDQRQHQLDARAQEVDRRTEQLHRDSRDLEEQAGQLDAWHEKLAEREQQLKKDQAAHETALLQLGQRATTIEGQQAMLATLRTRLERTREEAQRQEGQFASQRAELETLAADVKQAHVEVQRQREELDAERKLLDQERRRVEERSATLEAAVTRMRESQEAVEAEQKKLREEASKNQTTAAEQAEQSALVRERSNQLLELQERLAADRQTLRDRETALAQAEQTVAGLQEQLRRRAEDLATRERSLTEKTGQQESALGTLEKERAELERLRELAESELTVRRLELAEKVAALEERQATLAERERVLQGHLERLQEAGRKIGRERKEFLAEREQEEIRRRQTTEALAHELAAEETQRLQTLDEIARERAEVQAAREDIADLERQLPELEQVAQEIAERLTVARSGLREHLEEVHAYARQSRDDLDTARAQVHAAAEELVRQETGLQRARAEHNLAVAAFRQQLSDWQGRVGEMKRTLAQGESKLERRQAEVAEKARQVGETTVRLAQQAEQLQQQERLVAERRGEIDRHLDDMREWYRRKLRELAGTPDQPAGEADAAADALDFPTVPQTLSFEGDLPASPRDILALTGAVDPGDRRLGELLTSLELVEADTLAALLVEARKQRRSLRQALLASGCLTVYQMALIEAGNVDGLVLGPVRVVDRLRVTPRETVYRVFDPRGGREAVLRHLAESEAQDAVRPDEFRQRFAQAAAVRHPHVAATLEVVEINGRPAALQEWLTGVASTDWPALAAVPGAWFRLLNQAALGLRTAHEAGLSHGHLRATDVVLTSEGTLKLCGFGEPPWLVVPEGEGPDDTTADLAALGRIAAGWAALDATKKRSKPKLPKSLLAILQRLQAEAPEERYPSAAEVLEDLERAGADVPPNAAAWERLVRQVREEAVEGPALRQSA